MLGEAHSPAKRKHIIGTGGTMNEPFVRRLYQPPFSRFCRIVFASWLALALASVGGCTTRVADMAMPTPPTAPIPVTEIAPLFPAPPEQTVAQPPTEASQAIIGVDQKVQRAIREATITVGVDSTYLMVVAAKESSFDPRKRAHRTSATGLYQFTAKTWLRTVRAFGDRHGLADYAQQIIVDENGRVSMRSSAARAKLLRLRADPQIAALMAAELARDNETRLAHRLRRPVAPAEIYMAHLLGVTEAARVIEIARSAPHTPGARLLPAAARANPGRISVVIGYDEVLAHLIQAGADALVVPSRFEPCGLTQLCALRYGAVPIVARVGGLADTVVDIAEADVSDRDATGFKFGPVTPELLAGALRKANLAFHDKLTWRRLQHSGMTTDVSWRNRAGDYAALYRDILAARRA